MIKKIDKFLSEGIFDKRMKSMKADLDKKYGSPASGNLTDKVYNQLLKIPEFKKLGMDQQGEISMVVARMIGK